MSVSVSVSGQNPILPKGICARDMLGPSGSFLKMSLLDPSWTKNEPLNPHTQEAHRPIGGPFSGKKSDQPKDQVIIHHLALCGVVPLAPSGPPALRVY